MNRDRPRLDAERQKAFAASASVIIAAMRSAAAKARDESDAEALHRIRDLGGELRSLCQRAGRVTRRRCATPGTRPWVHRGVVVEPDGLLRLIYDVAPFPALYREWRSADNGSPWRIVGHCVDFAEVPETGGSDADA